MELSILEAGGRRKGNPPYRGMGKFSSDHTVMQYADEYGG